MGAGLSLSLGVLPSFISGMSAILSLLGTSGLNISFRIAMHTAMVFSFPVRVECSCVFPHPIHFCCRGC